MGRSVVGVVRLLPTPGSGRAVGIRHHISIVDGRTEALGPRGTFVSVVKLRLDDVIDLTGPGGALLRRENHDSAPEQNEMGRLCYLTLGRDDLTSAAAVEAALVIVVTVWLICGRMGAMYCTPTNIPPKHTTPYQNIFFMLTS